MKDRETRDDDTFDGNLPSDNPDDPDNDGLELHERRFIPPLPKGEYEPAAPNYLLQQKGRASRTPKSPDFSGVAFVEYGAITSRTLRPPHTLVISPASYGVIFSQYSDVLSHGLSLAKFLHHSYDRHIKVDYPDSTDLLMEAMTRYLAGDRTCTKTDFESAIAREQPAKCLGYCLFGNYKQGVLLSLVESLVPGKNEDAGTDHDLNLDPDFWTDIEREISIENVVKAVLAQASPHLRELVRQCASAGAFKPNSAVAHEVFCLCSDTELSADEIARQTGTPVQFVYSMRQCEKDGYVHRQIRKFGNKLPAMAALMKLSQPHLLDYHLQRTGKSGKTTGHRRDEA